VLLAYEQLLIEGYFVSRQREGTFVANGVGTGAQGAQSAQGHQISAEYGHLGCGVEQRVPADKRK